jgi:16S rRNA (guanine527-N7)-methyltransferase
MDRDAPPGRLQPEQEEKLRRFVEELQRRGERTNLVGSTLRGEIEKHVEDSLGASGALGEGARVVDLGSGAGFPGIPLAIVRPDLDLVLVEIRERRVHFLRHIVRTLGLGCRVDRRRIEEPEAQRFDVALLRAVAEPRESIRMALEWVVPGGEIWVWAGPGIEIAGASAIALGPRGRILRVPEARVPRGTHG